MPSICAIIPVKPFKEGKSRLSSVLSNQSREDQNRSFLKQTLLVAKSFPGPDATIVVSRSNEVLDIANLHGMIAISEPQNSDLNSALGYGVIAAQERGFQAMLYVPVDLPFLASESLKQIVERAQPPCLVLVPDRQRKGTNILYQSPIRLTRFAFGDRSLEKHCALAGASGLNVIISSIHNLSLDVDDARDLEALRYRKRLAFELSLDS